MSEADILGIWQQEADEAYRPIRWLPFWRPRFTVKYGRFSPWFWPPLWIAKTGAFNLFFLVIVSDDLLHCEPRYRRAIIAHEIGHLRGFHSIIWVLVFALALNEFIRSGLGSIGTHFGPRVAFGAFVVILVLITSVLRALLHWFERQADDYACNRVGAADMADTLLWLSERDSGIKRSRWVASRVRRLQLMQGLPAASKWPPDHG